MVAAPEEIGTKVAIPMKFRRGGMSRYIGIKSRQPRTGDHALAAGCTGEDPYQGRAGGVVGIPEGPVVDENVRNDLFMRRFEYQPVETTGTKLKTNTTYGYCCGAIRTATAPMMPVKTLPTSMTTVGNSLAPAQCRYWYRRYR